MIVKRILLLLLPLVFFLPSCHKATKKQQLSNAESKAVIAKIKQKGKIIASTDFNSINYFLYRGEPMGYQYELLQAFANYLGVKLEIVVNNDLQKSFECLDNGVCDMIAMDLTKTMSRSKIVDFSVPIIHGSLIDIFKPEAREWFWKKYQKQINIGVAAWWGDLGEPESHPSDIFHVNGKADAVHNIYGHNWDKMLSDKYAENYPHTRLFHLQRSGFAGSQRFSAFPWTGDVSRSWGGLQAQLPLLLTMGMNGLGYIHSDAGGFAMGEKDDELYTRWLQFATFTPILRPHGSNIPSEPVFFSIETQRIVRNSMKLRYAMLPYNYTLAWQNSENGAPLMRPLFYYFPDDSIARSVENEYFWGDNILVAPVIEKGLKMQEIYLPSGQWYDFNSGKRYSGNQWINYPLTMEYIPLFVKAGSFIPMTTPMKTTDDYTSNEFIVRYYPEGKSQFIQYEDDGWDKLAMEEGNYELISYNGNRTKEHTTISLSKKGSWKGMPKIRRMTFEVWNNDLPEKVLINGKEIPRSKSGKNNKSYYQMEDNRLKIHFAWDGKPQTIEIIN